MLAVASSKPASFLSCCLVLALTLAACESPTERSSFFDSARQAAALPSGAGTGRLPGDSGAAPEEAEAGGIEPFLQRGSGAFVNTGYRAPGPGRIQVAQAGPGEFTLNFADADLREVIRAMLQDALETNYTLDPRVQGTVTLQTSRPLTRDQVLPTLEEILRLNGAAMVAGEGVFRIVPAEEAGRAAPNLSFEDLRGRGLGVRVIPLRYVDAGEIEGLLQSFVPIAGGLQVEPGRNLVFLTGSRQEVTGLANLISVLDVDWMKGMSFALQPLKSTGPETMISELEQILNDPAGPNLANLLRFVPIERMNAVLVISKQPRYLDEALRWIGRLDQGGSDQQRIHVYYVQNRRAAELAEVLSQVFGVETSILGETSSTLAPGLTPITLSTGEPAEGEAELAPPPSPVAPPRAGSPAEGAIGLGGLGEVRIIADEASNSLVTLATRNDYEVVQAALRQLDILPLQVLIEATIAEVTLNDDLDFGLRWFFQQGNNEFSFSDFATGAVGAIFPGFNYVFQSGDVNVALNALKQITDVKVLSAPSIVVLDNQTARLEVGDEVPITTRSLVDTDDSDTVTNEVEQRNTGVILTVTPRVNAGGLVILEVVQEVSDAIETDTSNIDSPTIQQRKLESTIAIQSGESVALGGLVSDRVSETVSSVPVLGDIPLLGYLFKARSDEVERTELLVLLRPRVIRDSGDARTFTEELRRKLPTVFPPEVEPESTEDEPAEGDEGTTGPAGT